MPRPRVEFALNVVNPNLAGIGGGTAVVVRLANGDAWAIDGRELAPHADRRDQYQGKTAAAVGINGYSVGVPATLRTVDEMLKRWGTMSLADVLRSRSRSPTTARRSASSSRAAAPRHARSTCSRRRSRCSAPGRGRR